MFRPNFVRRRQNFEKTGLKRRFLHLLENFDQKNAFFRRALPPKILCIGAEGELKIFRPRHQNGYSTHSTKDEPFGSARGRILEGGVRPPLSVNPPLQIFNENLNFLAKSKLKLLILIPVAGPENETRACSGK